MSIQLVEILLNGNSLATQNTKQNFTVRVVVCADGVMNRYNINVVPNAFADVGLGAGLLQPSDELDIAMRGQHRALSLIVRAVSRQLRGERIALPLTLTEATAQSQRHDRAVNPRPTK